MKCLAGVEFEGGKPCPECGAKLGEVCWPGINAELREVVQLRKALQEISELEDVRSDEASGIARRALEAAQSPAIGKSEA